MAVDGGVGTYRAEENFLYGTKFPGVDEKNHGSQRARPTPRHTGAFFNRTAPGSRTTPGVLANSSVSTRNPLHHCKVPGYEAFPDTEPQL